jgi:hypothetical protein
MEREHVAVKALWEPAFIKHLATENPLICHREAALAAAAIHSSIRDLALDCFAALAMTPALPSLKRGG